MHISYPHTVTWVPNSYVKRCKAVLPRQLVSLTGAPEYQSMYDKLRAMREGREPMLGNGFSIVCIAKQYGWNIARVVTYTLREEPHPTRGDEITTNWYFANYILNTPRILQYAKDNSPIVYTDRRITLDLVEMEAANKLMPFASYCSEEVEKYFPNNTL